MEEVERVVITLPLHDSRAIGRGVKHIKRMGIRRRLPTKHPMLPLLLPIHLSPRSHNNKLSITHQLLNIRPTHQPILLNQFGWVHHIPLVGVDLVTVGHYDVEIVIEANPVNSETVHVHLDLEEVTHVDSSVS